MEQPQPLEVHRCPKCNALVLDRGSSACRTCHEPLPAEWLMTPDQAAKVKELDAHARAEHQTAMTDLDGIPTDSGETL